jgi:hypothetical protein
MPPSHPRTSGGDCCRSSEWLPRLGAWCAPVRGLDGEWGERARFVFAGMVVGFEILKGVGRAAAAVACSGHSNSKVETLGGGGGRFRTTLFELAPAAWRGGCA